MIKKLNILCLQIFLVLGLLMSHQNKFMVEIGFNNISDLDKLNKIGIDIDHHRTQKHVHAFVTHDQKVEIKNLGFSISTIPNLAKQYYEELKKLGIEQRNPMLEYHDYNELTAFLQNIAASYPSITRLESIGQSVQGKELWVMQISDNPGINEIEPEFKYVANMHGDETPGREFSLYLIEWLCENYGSSDRATFLVNNTDIYIMPTMNPDGFELGQRYNANNIDLNRDFPDQFYDPSNTLSGRQPETRAVMEWSWSHNFVLSANMHSGALVVNYPYDGPNSGSYSACPDDDMFVHISTAYSDAHPNMEQGGFNNGITNGSQWYAIDGGMQDWNYVWEQDFDVTLEQSQTKWPNSNQLSSLWNQHREPLLVYLEQIHTGLKGLILDSSTGQPVNADIKVDGIDKIINPDLQHGDYYRLLSPGTYTVTAEAYGYFSQTVTVNIDDLNASVHDFNMEPIPQEPYLDFVSQDAGLINSGDQASMFITLSNIGIGTATGVSAQLSSSSPFVSVTNSYSSFPNISQNSQGTSNNPFAFSVSPSCPSNTLINFNLAISSNQGSWEQNFGIAVGLEAEDFETAGLSSLDWSMSGSSDWFVTENEAYEGSYSARSGNISDNQQSVISITMEASNSGSISFYKKVSSEENYDYLRFFIDNTEKGSWAGEIDWSQESYQVQEGEHTYRWEFDKDGSVSEGSDCGWIDSVVFPPTESDSPVVVGDLNFDGTINILDVVISINFVLGVDYPSDIETLASDINGDGTINVLDIVLLVNIILGA